MWGVLSVPGAAVVSGTGVGIGLQYVLPGFVCV